MMLLEYVAAARPLGQKKQSRSPHYHSLLRRLNAMRIPYAPPKQGLAGAFCSICILGAVGVSAFQTSLPVPSPAPTREAAAP